MCTKTPTMYPLTCGHCGQAFAARRSAQLYCSVVCGGKAGHPGNVDRVCVVCDEPFSISLQFDRPTCSRACAGWLRRHPDGSKPVRECQRCGGSLAGMTLKARYCSRLCIVAARSVKAGKNKSFRVRPAECLLCGASLSQRTFNALYCSRACQAKRGHQYRSAALSNQPVEAVPVGGIFALWDWHCHICGEPIDKTLRGQHPMMGSLDHIIPVSHPDYPGHVWENLAPAHLCCNIRKGSLPSDADLDLYASLAALRRLSVA